jgi:hypothetical protein
MDDQSEEILKPTEAGVQAADDAVKAIKGKSFSGRHPELGKMIKCQVCRTRHRSAKVCTQKFAQGRYDLRDPKPLLIAGETAETRPVPPKTGIKVVLGAQVFKGKRIKPHFNKRANEFIQLVYTLVPDEYTHEELEKARNKAKRILAAKYGRHGYLPPIWKKFPKENKDVPETV